MFLVQNNLSQHRHKKDLFLLITKVSAKNFMWWAMLVLFTRLKSLQINLINFFRSTWSAWTKEAMKLRDVGRLQKNTLTAEWKRGWWWKKIGKIWGSKKKVSSERCSWLKIRHSKTEQYYHILIFMQPTKSLWCSSLNQSRQS